MAGKSLEAQKITKTLSQRVLMITFKMMQSLAKKTASRTIIFKDSLIKILRTNEKRKRTRLLPEICFIKMSSAEQLPTANHWIRIFES